MDNLEKVIVEKKFLLLRSTMLTKPGCQLCIDLWRCIPRKVKSKLACALLGSVEPYNFDWLHKCHRKPRSAAPDLPESEFEEQVFKWRSNRSHQSRNDDWLGKKKRFQPLVWSFLTSCSTLLRETRAIFDRRPRISVSCDNHECWRYKKGQGEYCDDPNITPALI